MATQITRNDWDHITSERFDFHDGLAVVAARTELLRVAKEFGYRITFCAEESWTRYDGVVMPPQFSTCINATKLNTPVDKPTFCCTSAQNTTLENLNYCIKFIKECK